MDLDGDGKVTKEELEKYKKDNTSLISRYTWNGSTGRSIRRYEEMLEGKDSIDINDVLEKSAEKAKLDTQSLPTANQISTEKTNKEQVQSTRDLKESIDELIEIEKENGQKIVNVNQDGEKKDGAYSNRTASGAGQRRGG